MKELLVVFHFEKDPATTAQLRGRCQRFKLIHHRIVTDFNSSFHLK